MLRFCSGEGSHGEDGQEGQKGEHEEGQEVGIEVEAEEGSLEGEARSGRGLILVAKNVPESKVGVTTDGFINAGATKVAKKKEAKGKYTLTAAFPR